jgi:hypothetical protein
MSRQRLNIEISLSTLRKLILWAYTRDEKKNSWARTVLILRCDENEEKVNKWFENEAGRLGITKEELEDYVLKKEGFNVEEYKKEIRGE